MTWLGIDGLMCMHQICLSQILDLVSFYLSWRVHCMIFFNFFFDLTYARYSYIYFPSNFRMKSQKWRGSWRSWIIKSINWKKRFPPKTRHSSRSTLNTRELRRKRRASRWGIPIHWFLTSLLVFWKREYNVNALIFTGKIRTIKKILCIWMLPAPGYARMARVPFWSISVPQRVGFSSNVPLRVGFWTLNVWQRGYGFSSGCAAVASKLLKHHCLYAAVCYIIRKQKSLKFYLLILGWVATYEATSVRV